MALLAGYLQFCLKRVMSGSYASGFGNFMKSEHHEVNMVVVPFVKSGR